MNRTSFGVLLVLIILLMLPIKHGMAQNTFPSGFPLDNTSNPFKSDLKTVTTPPVPAVVMPLDVQEPGIPGRVPDTDRAREQLLPEEKPSAFELYVQSLPGELGSPEQFGYNLFRKPPSTFAPVDYVPISPDYLLGPGDEIRVSIWGNINGEFTAIVDTDGKIVVPTIGIVHLSGLTFSEAKKHLEKERMKMNSLLILRILLRKLSIWILPVMLKMLF